MTDPSICLVKHFVWRKLQALTTFHLPDDRQGTSVGRPIRPFNILPNLPRSPADQRHSRERAGIKELRSGVTSERECHLARNGDGQNVGSRRPQLLRLRALRSSCEQFEWLAFPGSAVDDCFPVRGKTRGVDNATTERQRVVDRKRNLHGTVKQEHSCGQADNESDCSGYDRHQQSAFLWHAPLAGRATAATAPEDDAVRTASADRTRDVSKALLRRFRSPRSSAAV